MTTVLFFLSKDHQALLEKVTFIISKNCNFADVTQTNKEQALCLTSRRSAKVKHCCFKKFQARFWGSDTFRTCNAWCPLTLQLSAAYSDLLFYLPFSPNAHLSIRSLKQPLSTIPLMETRYSVLTTIEFLHILRAIKGLFELELHLMHAVHYHRRYNSQSVDFCPCNESVNFVRTQS